MGCSTTCDSRVPWSQTGGPFEGPTVYFDEQGEAAEAALQCNPGVTGACRVEHCRGFLTAACMLVLIHCFHHRPLHAKLQLPASARSTEPPRAQRCERCGGRANSDGHPELSRSPIRRGRGVALACRPYKAWSRRLKTAVYAQPKGAGSVACGASAPAAQQPKQRRPRAPSRAPTAPRHPDRR